MIEQTGNALVFYAHYIETKVGKTGLTVTVDVYRNSSIIVTAASATEVAGGLYKYELASGSNNAEGEYIAIFKTATSTVDQQWIPALWVTNKAGVENLDATIVSRLPTASYTAPLDAAGTRSAIGLASANLDTQLDTLPTAIENADALLDRSAGVETGVTLRQAQRLILSALVGKLSGAATTTITIRNTADNKSRVIATVDSDGNRSAVTLDTT